MMLGRKVHWYGFGNLRITQEDCIYGYRFASAEGYPPLYFRAVHSRPPLLPYIGFLARRLGGGVRHQHFGPVQPVATIERGWLPAPAYLLYRTDRSPNRLVA